MADPILVYGAYGYTGELVAREAVARGLVPILAGRREAPLARLANSLGLEHRAFALEDPAAVDRGLAGIAAVLHCAGPFVHTARPMAEGCLRARAHYLDITGELPAFAAIEALGPAAQAAGVVLLPGAGYDVVPTDCLAAHLARRLPGAERLRLGVAGLARPSRGTTRTVLEQLSVGWTPPRGVPGTRAIDFGRGPTPCALVPWGDVFTAPRTTGIADVAVYMPAGGAQRLLPVVAPLLRLRFVRALAIRAATGGLPGPTEDERARGRSAQWGEASDRAGARVEARQGTVEPYRFTALAMVELARRVLAGEASPGFRTPAGAFGPDLVLAIPGSTREEVV
jgi:short subunit dehydrogenase-like uncharacterized protein